MGVSDLGRFSDPALFILVSLAGGEKHGYAMMEDIKRRHGIDLGPGTLYGAITRLEDTRLIEPLPAEDRRRPYRLTPTGEAALGEQLRALHRFTVAGLERLALS